MINEILSKTERKPLSSYITLLTGLPLLMWFLKKYGNISIESDYLDFIVFDANSTPQSFIKILVVIVTIPLVIDIFNRKIIYKCLNKNTGEIKNHEFLIVYFTIENLLDILSAVAALLLSILLQNEGIKIKALKILVPVLIGYKLLSCIYYHYYYKNLKMTKEHLKD